MEECGGQNSKKRGRDESGADSLALKRCRDDSLVLERFCTELKGESVPDSDKSPRFEDLLGILEDTDADRELAVQDLDSVIRSFEEEIHVPTQPSSTDEPAEPTASLRYLFEASDDALGLPSGFSGGEDGLVELQENFPDSAGIAEFSGFGDEFPSYDSFEFGISGGSESGNNGNGGRDGDFVTVGGLFDYSDPGYDGSDFLWQPDRLHAA